MISTGNEPVFIPVSANTDANGNAKFSQIARQALWTALSLSVTATLGSTSQSITWIVSTGGTVVGTGTARVQNIGPFVIPPGADVTIVLSTGNSGDSFAGTLEGWAAAAPGLLPESALTASGSQEIIARTTQPLWTASSHAGGSVVVSGTLAAAGILVLSTGTVFGAATLPDDINLVSMTIGGDGTGGQTTLALQSQDAAMAYHTIWQQLFDGTATLPVTVFPYVDLHRLMVVKPQIKNTGGNTINVRASFLWDTLP